MFLFGFHFLLASIPFIIGGGAFGRKIPGGFWAEAGGLRPANGPGRFGLAGSIADSIDIIAIKIYISYLLHCT